MKVKILMMPLIIVITVAVLIWLVYPAYSNGIDGVRENYNKLKTEQAKLTELRNKNENTNSLSAQISSLSEKNVLFDFVPVDIKEEEIINGTVNLAKNAGLLLIESNINQPARETNSQEEDQLINMNMPDSSNNPSLPVLPKKKDLKTDVKLIGNYEKIKDFLNSIDKFSRSNDFEILEISKNNLGAESTDQSILSVNATINFNVLKKAKLNSTSISDPVLSNPQLETKIINDIKNQKNANNFEIIIEQKGKNNIFQP